MSGGLTPAGVQQAYLRQDSLADSEHFEMLTKLSYFIHSTQTVHKDGGCDL